MLFVFKLSEGLDEKPTVEYYGPDGTRIGEKYESYLTHKEILKHCLKVFRAQDHTKCPKILVIGTHKDHPQKLNDKDLEECLKPFQNNVVNFGDQSITKLDCTSKENNEKVEEIRKQLQVLTKDIKNENINCTEIEQTPMAWFGLELALKKESQSKNVKRKGILSLEQCKMEADRFEYFSANSGQFDAALEHLVKHNIFLYYKDVLPNVVFCDPQVLLTMVTKIVHYHYKLKHSECAVTGTSFRDNAYVSAKILSEISPEYDNNDEMFSSELFFKLLSDLKLISSINTSGEYLMPALLQNADDLAAKVGEIKDKEQLPPLCISFDEGCAPSGVFCSLVATLLQQKHWKLCMNHGKPYCCFRNCVTFTFQETTVITLVDYFSHFSIYMYRPTHSKDKDMQLTVKDGIHESIHMIAERLQYSNLKFQDAIPCPAHSNNKTHVHVALWKHQQPGEKDYYKCTVSDMNTGDVPNAYTIWMKTTGTEAVSDTQHKCNC